MMILSEDTVEKYLRPKAVAEAALTNGWGESEHVWVADPKEGFILTKLIDDDRAVSEDGGMQVELIDQYGRQKVVLKSNPSRNDRTEDIASMTELNEATVLHNLRKRYQTNLIYTYSGLFLVAVNPYKSFPIYSDSIMSWYRRSSRNERPPHIFATADGAYQAMLEIRRPQSILITGESGAGKTENTKRVIQYLACIAGGVAGGLEARIIQANPIMEAFGNAQTVRNNNSSRFGKFIRIEFNQAGTIIGASIEKYLLEKSRVTNRDLKERNFHIFYQYLKGAPTELKVKFGITGGVQDYAYTKDSNADIEGLDDMVEFNALLGALETLGMSNEEQEDLFKVVSIILLLGNISLSEDLKGQAQFFDKTQVDTVCKQLGVDVEDFSTALLNPIIKAGSEQVSQGRDIAQVTQSIEALSRSLYERLFNRLVDRLNRAISSNSVEGGLFIGVLDMAGFEIFQRNSFEQLCINYTNEKLQQFFNHHMFVSEQAEYEREKVEWSFVDFGLDLQPTIDLIEKSNPIGVLACLDEDCVVPKATDKSFCEKLIGMWKGRSEKFETTRFADNAFAIQHYAGRVEYSTDGWLEKNKDPLNENVTRLFAKSDCQVIAEMFLDYNDEGNTRFSRPIGKRGQFRTVAQKYRESLALLMQTLQSTEPHFVRCIVPNGEKKAGVLEPNLVLDQLKCNGVLEGIRICRMGFPNRIPYADFCRLYEILSNEPLEQDRRKATKQLLAHLGIKEEQYRVGLTKIFYKVGVISGLDEKRDQKLSSIIKSFQAHCRGALIRRSKGQLVRQHEAKLLLQRNMKQHLALQKWPWWRLLCRVKPLLNVTRAENRIEELEDEVERLSSEKDQQTAQLRTELDAERNKLLQTETSKRDYERQLQQVELQLTEAVDTKAMLMERLQNTESELSTLRKAHSAEVMQLTCNNAKLQDNINDGQKEHEQEVSTLKQRINSLHESIEQNDNEMTKLEKNESSLRSKIVDLESQLEESRLIRKDLEQRVKSLEIDFNQLQERLEDNQLTKEAQSRLQTEFDTSFKALKLRHEEELSARQDEFETLRKRMQREILQLTADLEEERKQVASQRETIRQYESGNDNLTNQLEAEIRNQEAWKREKERLENRIKDIIRLNQEATEREDTLQAAIFTSNEQARDLRSRIMQLEDDLLTNERNKKSLEAKMEKISEQIEVLQSKLSESEHKRNELDSKLSDAYTKLAEEQDEVVVLKERLRTSEHVGKLNGLKADEALRHYEDAQADIKRLETQFRNLQLRYVDTSNDAIDTGSLKLGQATIQTLYQLRAQLEAESEERQSTLRESRRLERTIRDLQAQLTDSDRDRIALEEGLAKHEIRYRKLQTRIDQLEQSLSDSEFVKRKTDRELFDERDEKDRLQREMDRLKQRYATLQQAN